MDPSEISKAEYRIEFLDSNPEEVAAALSALLCQPALMVEKKSKKGLITVDILPFLEVKEQHLGDKSFSVVLRLPAGTQSNINPNLLIGLLAAQRPVELVRVVKTRLFGPDGMDFA